MIIRYYNHQKNFRDFADEGDSVPHCNWVRPFVVDIAFDLVA